MDYREFRSQFKTVEEFNEAFGCLSEEEAMAMIRETETSAMVKACMATAWRTAHKKTETMH